jgi:flagellar protein FliS
MTKSGINSALNKYQAVGVSSGIEGASAHRLVQMLMEGALDKMAIAKGLIERKDFEGKSKYISWAISIINGLRDSLDGKAGGEIAVNLDNLYDYMTRRLIEANSNNDIAIIEEVISLMLEIKSAWDVMPEHVKNMTPRGAASMTG